MKILTVIGARPQFIKAATVSRAIREHNSAESGTPIHEVIVHTGQHFDANMSEVFFEQLDIPRPDHHLGIASLSHGAMTGRMLEGIESLIQHEHPDWVLVYGDTNSTLAGALAAAKLQVPVAHVEAGLRSYNPAMPEEINRVLTDRISTLLLCPTQTAVDNLHREGFPFPTPRRGKQRIEQVGDVMYDAVLHYRDHARERISLDTWGLEDQSYALCTLHRQENTDDPERLSAILAALRDIARELPVVLPLHPRTRQKLEQQGALAMLDRLRIVDPLPYLEMQRLQMSARLILTDSGGMQNEGCERRNVLRSTALIFPGTTRGRSGAETLRNRLRRQHRKPRPKVSCTGNP
jgi:UDP-GlcNAc3NAcA epimerase